MGMIPGAYRSAGGHWRVTTGRRVVSAALNAIASFQRNCSPHGVADSEAYRNPPKGRAKGTVRPNVSALLSLWDLRCRQAKIDPDAAAGLVTQTTRTRLIGLLPSVSEKQLAILKAAVQSNVAKTQLMTAIAAVKTRGDRPTKRAVAAALGVSRATLYRRFGASAIAKLIKQTDD